MNICKHILIAALTFSLITQSFASQTARAMEVVRSNYTGRMDAYNALPTDNRIPHYSGTLNQLFARGPNKEPVRAEDLKGIQARVLKAVMGTTLIHSDNMLLAAHGIDPRNTSEFRHHEILRITQEMSQRFALETTVNSVDDVLATIGTFDEINILKTYGGIEVDDLKTWFKDVYLNHNQGLSHRTGMHWRDPASYKTNVSQREDDEFVGDLAAAEALKRAQAKEQKPAVQKAAAPHIREEERVPSNSGAADGRAAAEDSSDIDTSHTTFDEWKRTAVGQNVTQMAQLNALTTSKAGKRDELDAADPRQNFPYELTPQAFVNFFHYINQYVIPAMRGQNKKVHAYLDINHDSLTFENVRDNRVPQQQLQRAKQIADSGLIWVKPVQFNPNHWWTLSVQKELGTYLIKIWNSSGSEDARQIDQMYEEQIKRLFSDANGLTEDRVKTESKQLGVQVGTLSCGIWVLDVIENLIKHGNYNPTFTTGRDKVTAEADLIDRLFAYTYLALARKEVNEEALNAKVAVLRTERNAAGAVYDKWAYEPIQGEMNIDYLGRFSATLQEQFKNDPDIISGNLMGRLAVILEKIYEENRDYHIIEGIKILRRNVLDEDAYRKEDKAAVKRIPQYVKDALAKLLELIETNGLDQDYETLPPTNKEQILALLGRTIDIFNSRVAHAQNEKIHRQLLDLADAIRQNNKDRIEFIFGKEVFTQVMDKVTQDKSLFPEVLNFTTFRGHIRRIDPRARAEIIGGGSAAALNGSGRAAFGDHAVEAREQILPPPPAQGVAKPYSMDDEDVTIGTEKVGLAQLAGTYSTKRKTKQSSEDAFTNTIIESFTENSADFRTNLGAAAAAKLEEMYKFELSLGDF